MTNEAKSTPGQLTVFMVGDIEELGIRGVVLRGDAEAVRAVVQYLGDPVCLCPADEDHVREAAPDTREATERLLSLIEDCERVIRMLGGVVVDAHGDKDFARAAIARAEGR